MTPFAPTGRPITASQSKETSEVTLLEQANADYAKLRDLSVRTQADVERLTETITNLLAEISEKYGVKDEAGLAEFIKKEEERQQTQLAEYRALLDRLQHQISDIMNGKVPPASDVKAERGGNV
ncbi:hypothetical protein ACFOY8_13200 [Thalassospira xianhensis]|uniref:Uncharacterized protein n=2 Tax=Thalassospira TaxID=168934 RepID=A0A285TXE3_9PROT|nr:MULTISPECIES: hypothetical protein [Thalassospira]RCK07839.1 hypothetical protein TH5_02090 [Thalassospira xianhensis MCCC 1A02616]SOC27202.1 hypothetical protein SAMN05428964_105304 [Thalassospira xiamenensis]